PLPPARPPPRAHTATDPAHRPAGLSTSTTKTESRPTPTRLLSRSARADGFRLSNAGYRFRS
ncbi:MAG: hypothetical protein ACK5OB_08740, partial [Pirellula sp.]